MKESMVGSTLRADLVVKNIDNELLVLDKANDKIHQLNGTASIIWARLVDGATQEVIAKEIAEEFDIALETAEKDVDRTIKQLRDLSLLQPAE